MNKLLRKTISFLTSTTELYYPRIFGFIFLFSFILLCFTYNFDEILFKRPQSVHQWRQTDCLSFALNYYQDGMDFSNPSIHNLIADNQTTGKTKGEFPVLYFFVAILWKIFGYHEFIYRLVVLALTFLGLWNLYKIIERITRNSFIGISFSLLFFASPVIVFYSANFLTNLPAFSLVLIGWNFFFKFYLSKKDWLFFLSIFFFLLAGLLKITALVSVIAIFGYLILEWLGILGIKKEDKVFPVGIKYVIPFILLFLVNFLWYSHARSYNQLHGGWYTFNGTWPIWKMAKTDISDTINAINKLWLKNYFNYYTHILILTFLIIQVLIFKKIPKFLNLVTLFTLLGVIAYTLLWFNAFKYHDYYVINLYIFPVLVLISFSFLIGKEKRRLIHSPLAYLLIFSFLTVNLIESHKTFAPRYKEGSWILRDQQKYFKAFENITPYLRSLGIKKEDKVISIRDDSFNISLYLMNQKGFTSYGNDYSQSGTIENKIKLGAKYLLINDQNLLSETYLKPYLGKNIGNFENIQIFKLQ
ncbi:MAG: glycosyltransferase family 39 protein [bacterium]